MNIKKPFMATTIYLASCIFLTAVCSKAFANKDIMPSEKPRIIKKAMKYMAHPPVTVTAHIASRSKGSKHDFYSEGDYWWPNPEDLDGPYIRRDGESNPANFIEHRLSMIRLSEIIGTLASAYLIQYDKQYV